jgi:CRP-like cAMP-binding protein
MSINPALFAPYTVLRGLSSRSATQLAKRATLEQRRTGDYLFRAGECSDSTYFLVSGRLAYETPAGLLAGQLHSHDDAAREPLPEDSPHPFSARCLSDVEYLAIDSALLEVMLSWGREPRVDVGELSSTTVCAEDDWMLRLLQRRSFQQLPAQTLQSMFMRMSAMTAAPGERLIHQGGVGDYFYVIVKGRCRVLREAPGQASVSLASFGPGDCFGEESLLSGLPRNASVEASTAMELLRIGQADFAQLLVDAWTRRLEPRLAISHVAAGTARWLDVRLPSERGDRPMPDSLGIPLYRLRARLGELPAEMAYICICDSGRRSAVAAFILAHHGLEAYSLEGGLPELPGG